MATRLPRIEIELDPQRGARPRLRSSPTSLHDRRPTLTTLGSGKRTAFLLWVIALLMFCVGCSTPAWDGTADRWGTLREVLRDGDQLLFRTTFFGTHGMLPVEDDVFFLGDAKTFLRIERRAQGEHGDLLWEMGHIRAFGAENDAGNTESALEIAEQAFEAFPMSSMAHTLLAVGLAKSGDPTVAVELLEAALELDPENQDALEILAELSAE